MISWKNYKTLRTVWRHFCLKIHLHIDTTFPGSIWTDPKQWEAGLSSDEEENIKILQIMQPLPPFSSDS